MEIHMNWTTRGIDERYYRRERVHFRQDGGPWQDKVMILRAVMKLVEGHKAPRTRAEVRPTGKSPGSLRGYR